MRKVMSENKKFTEQELKDIKTLRDSYASKVTEFGQVELEFLAVKSRKEYAFEANLTAKHIDGTIHSMTIATTWQNR